MLKMSNIFMCLYFLEMFNRNKNKQDDIKKYIVSNSHSIKRTKGLSPNISANEITDMKNTFKGCKNDNKK